MKNISRRNRWLIAALAAAVVIALLVLVSVIIAVSIHRAGIGIIGGADGPTAIFVARTTGLLPVGIGALLVAGAVILLILFLRRQR